MVSHQEVAERKGGRTEGVEVRPEVWMELLPEVPGTEGTEVRREVEGPLTSPPPFECSVSTHRLDIGRAGVEGEGVEGGSGD